MTNISLSIPFPWQGGCVRNSLGKPARPSGGNGKSGYMPAYNFNRDEFAKHKAQGGALKIFRIKNIQD